MTGWANSTKILPSKLFAATDGIAKIGYQAEFVNPADWSWSGVPEDLGATFGEWYAHPGNGYWNYTNPDFPESEYYQQIDAPLTSEVVPENFLYSPTFFDVGGLATEWTLSQPASLTGPYCSSFGVLMKEYDSRGTLPYPNDYRLDVHTATMDFSGFSITETATGKVFNPVVSMRGKLRSGGMRTIVIVCKYEEPTA